MENTALERYRAGVPGPVRGYRSADPDDESPDVLDPTRRDRTHTLGC